MGSALRFLLRTRSQENDIVLWKLTWKLRIYGETHRGTLKRCGGSEPARPPTICLKVNSSQDEPPSLKGSRTAVGTGKSRRPRQRTSQNWWGREGGEPLDLQAHSHVGLISLSIRLPFLLRFQPHARQANFREHFDSRDSYFSLQINKRFAFP